MALSVMELEDEFINFNWHFEMTKRIEFFMLGVQLKMSQLDERGGKIDELIEKLFKLVSDGLEINS